MATDAELALAVAAKGNCCPADPPCGHQRKATRDQPQGRRSGYGYRVAPPGRLLAEGRGTVRSPYRKGPCVGWGGGFAVRGGGGAVDEQVRQARSPMGIPGPEAACSPPSGGSVLGRDEGAGRGRQAGYFTLRGGAAAAYGHCRGPFRSRPGGWRAGRRKCRQRAVLGRIKRASQRPRPRAENLGTGFLAPCSRFGHDIWFAVYRRFPHPPTPQNAGGFSPARGAPFGGALFLEHGDSGQSETFLVNASVTFINNDNR